MLFPISSNDGLNTGLYIGEYLDGILVRVDNSTVKVEFLLFSPSDLYDNWFILHYGDEVSVLWEYVKIPL